MMETRMRMRMAARGRGKQRHRYSKGNRRRSKHRGHGRAQWRRNDSRHKGKTVLCCALFSDPTHTHRERKAIWSSKKKERGASRA